MPQITRIVSQKKDKERVNIYLDGKFAFATTLESVLLNGLKSGKELSLQKINELKNAGDLSKVINKALAFATTRPRSEREILLWFKRKKIEEQLHEGVLNKLKSLGLINDLEFAKWWVDQRNTFRPKGKQALKAELMQKGINREIIDEVLADTGRDSELENAKKILQKRLPRYLKLEPQDALRKMLTFLGGRGFSYDVSRRAIDELTEKE